MMKNGFLAVRSRNLGTTPEDPSTNHVVLSRLDRMRDYAARHRVPLSRVYYDHKGNLCSEGGDDE